MRPNQNGCVRQTFRALRTQTAAPTVTTMAAFAHHSKILFLRSCHKSTSSQVVRTCVLFRRAVAEKEHFDADKFEDGTTVQAIMDRMATRGFCRPERPYTPPQDLRERLMALFKKHLPQADLSDLQKVPLTQPTKVRLLAECVREFDHDIPNYELGKLKTLGDVGSFFSSEVEGLNPYDKLVAHKDELPENLHVIPEGIRFHPDTDTMFKGVTAFPGRGCKVSGLRTRKKYASWSMDSGWPYEIHTSKIR